MKKGLTLIELLIVIGIIAVLAGILYVALAPAKRKAQLAHCVNNFRQIHLAIESYRQDWDGVDEESASSFSDLGLPPEVYFIAGFFPFDREVYIVGTKDIWKCPVYNYNPRSVRHVGPDYVYIPSNYFMASKIPELKGDAETIERAFKKRRGELPIVTDDWHDFDFPDPYSNGGLLLIILRLNGNIDVKMVQPTPPGVYGYEVN